MISTNVEVSHKTFGKGVILSVSGKYFTVKFNIAQKTFVYPDAFENFLTLSDGTVSDEILLDIEGVRAERQRIIDAKNAENLRAMTKGIVIPGKETVSGDNEDEESRFKNTDTEEV
jgi:hypothetical protein